MKLTNLGWHASHRDAAKNSRERRAQVVRDGAQQRSFHEVAPAEGFGLDGFLFEPAAIERHREQRRECRQEPYPGGQVGVPVREGV